MVEAKIRYLEGQIDKQPPRQVPHVEREIYEAQIKCLKEDFAQERADREKMASRAEALERMLTEAKQQYGKLERRLYCMQNVHRAEYNRIYGKDPSWYQSDTGPERTDDGGSEET